MNKIIPFLFAVLLTYQSNACTIGFSYTYLSVNTITFVSTAAGFTGAVSYQWDFGDGNVSTTANPVNTYSFPGNYRVTLIVTSTGGCMDSTSTIVTCVPGISLSGNIIRDSSIGPLTTDTLLLWLITYDTVTHIIAAIDSTGAVATFPGTSTMPYSFSYVPPGNYLIKVASMIYTSGGIGWVPTYLDSSVLWSAANYVTVGTSSVSGADIYQRYGTTTTGPGFIAGDVRTGAGKATAVGDPVSGQLIYLLNSSRHMVSSTYTNTSGVYNFSNIPMGTYSVYPETLGYTTTAWNSITVSSAETIINNINFSKNSTSIKPNTTSIQTFPTTKNLIVPNPSNGIIQLQYVSVNAPINISLTNVTGQKVYESILQTNSEGKCILNVSHLPNGVYFIDLITQSVNTVQKIVIQH